MTLSSLPSLFFTSRLSSPLCTLRSTLSFLLPPHSPLFPPVSSLYLLFSSSINTGEVENPQDYFFVNRAKSARHIEEDEEGDWEDDDEEDEWEESGGPLFTATEKLIRKSMNAATALERDASSIWPPVLPSSKLNGTSLKRTLRVYARCFETTT